MRVIIVLAIFCVSTNKVAAQYYFNNAFNANNINYEVYRGVIYDQNTNSIIIDGGVGGSNYPYLVQFDLAGGCLDTVIIENTHVTSQFIPGFNNTLISDNNGYSVLNGTLQSSSISAKGYIVKLNGNFDTLWTRTFGIPDNLDGLSGSVISKDSAYVFAGVTMSFSGGIDDQDFWLMKLDTAGNLLWQNAFGGSNTDYALSVDTTLDGGYIIGGFTSSYGAGGNDIYIVKTDAGGNFQWHKWYGLESYDSGFIKALPSGNFIVYGGYNYVNPNNSSEIALHGIVMELDQNGNQIWFKEYSNYAVNSAFYYTLDEGFNSMEILSDGYIFSGGSKDTLDSNPVGWVIKTDFNGNQLWSRSFRKRDNDNYFYAMTSISGGDFVFAGFVFPDGTGNTQDGWIVRTNCLGFDQPPSADANSYNGDGNVIVLDNNSANFGDCIIDWGDGNSTTVTEFDDSLVSHQYLVSGTYQIEIIAIACNDSDTAYVNVNATPLGIENFEFGNNFKMYPNPANSMVNIVFSFSENSAVSIYDLSGKIIYSKIILEQTQNLEIDLSDFESGTYIVSIQTESEIISKKLIVR